MTQPVARDLIPALLAALADLPVVVLTGMRQTGKSTLLTSTKDLSGRRYATLDDFAQLEAARADPEGFLAGDEPLTIDEVQRAPELLVAVKRAVDQDRRPGRFLLSGSANLSLLKGVSESLAGRAVYLTLRPFSLREVRRRTDDPASSPPSSRSRGSLVELRRHFVRRTCWQEVSRRSRWDRSAIARCGSAGSYRRTSSGTCGTLRRSRTWRPSAGSCNSRRFALDRC